MTVASFAAILAAGRIFMFLLRRFPFRKLPIIKLGFEEGKFLDELFSCDLCLGFWVYTGLSALLGLNVYGDYWFYVPVVTEVLSGSVLSFTGTRVSAR